MRKRRKRVQTAAIYAIGFLEFLIAFPAVGYVHENARKWEAAAVFISLGLGVLPALWYWHTRRHGWVVGILTSLLLMFSGACAIFHGWETLVVALYGVAVVVYTVAFFVFMSRTTRRVQAALRAVGKELNGDPLFSHEIVFRDDGQRIIVYPRWRRLVVLGMVQAALLAGIGGVFAFWRADILRLWIPLGLFACLLFVALLSTLARLVSRRPSLTVGPDGLLDDVSLVWSGVGLVRWDEILSVVPDTISSGCVKQRFLTILVTDLPAIRRRLPLVKRLALRMTYTGLSELYIAQLMLEAPVSDLAVQIGQYVEAHAPPGWFKRAPESGELSPDGAEA